MPHPNRGMNILVLACVLAACGDPLPPTRLTDTGLTSRRQMTAAEIFQDRRPLHAAYLEISKQVPEFAGVYNDSAGRLHIVTTRADKMTAAKAELARIFVTHTRQLAAPTVVDVARYNFTQLAEWYARLHEQLGVRGLVSTRISAQRNAIVVIVDNESAAASTRTRLGELGVPADAFVVRVGERPVQLSDLNDKVRPVRGGLRSSRYVSTGTPGVYDAYHCTLGYSGYRDRLKGFVVPSHCTNFEYGTDYTKRYQWLRLSSDGIGEERYDPPAFMCVRSGINTLCRNSDAAWFQYGDDVVVSINMIAKTSTGTTIAAGNQWTITGEYWHYLAWDGLEVRKTGRITGTTTGLIHDSCTDVYAPDKHGNDVWLICQAGMASGGGGGDSGSPVYQVLSGDNVSLVGMVWGGTGCNDQTGLGCTDLIYSPMSQINLDLGTITRAP